MGVQKVIFLGELLCDAKMLRGSPWLPMLRELGDPCWQCNGGLIAVSCPIAVGVLCSGVLSCVGCFALPVMFYIVFVYVLDYEKNHIFNMQRQI